MGVGGREGLTSWVLLSVYGQATVPEQTPDPRGPDPQVRRTGRASSSWRKDTRTQEETSSRLSCQIKRCSGGFLSRASGSIVFILLPDAALPSPLGWFETVRLYHPSTPKGQLSPGQERVDLSRMRWPVQCSRK